MIYYNMEVEKYITRKNNILNEISDLKNLIIKLKEEEKMIDKILWDKCEHVWTLDNSSADDDLCKRYCKTCGLYQNRYLYT